MGTAISKDKSHGEQDTKRLCEVPSLKIWSKIRQFGELGSVSAQPFPPTLLLPTPNWGCWSASGKEKAASANEEGLVQWTQEGREQIELPRERSLASVGQSARTLAIPVPSLVLLRVPH